LVPILAALLLIAGAASSGRAADASAPAESSPEVAVAKQWFAALRHHDLDKLKGQTRYPFAFRDTHGSDCTGGTAANAEALPHALKCLFDGDVFAQDSQEESAASSPAQVLTKDKLPSWSKRWWKKVPSGTTPVHLYFDAATGSYHEIVLFIADDGVREMWKRTTFDRG
jgi:hypothetical protein